MEGPRVGLGLSITSLKKCTLFWTIDRTTWTPLSVRCTTSSLTQPLSSLGKIELTPSEPTSSDRCSGQERIESLDTGNGSASPPSAPPSLPMTPDSLTTKSPQHSPQHPHPVPHWGCPTYQASPGSPACSHPFQPPPPP